MKTPTSLLLLVLLGLLMVPLSTGGIEHDSIGPNSVPSSPVHATRSLLDSDLVLGVLIGLLLGAMRGIQQIIRAVVSFVSPRRWDRRW